jgi:hypothetical protein
MINGYQGNFLPAVPCAIANSGTVSAAITMNGMSLCGIKLPAAFTGTALTFQVCDTLAGSYVALKKADGSSLSYTVAQGTYVAIDPKDFYGVQFLKIVSGTTETGARTLLLALKGL